MILPRVFTYAQDSGAGVTGAPFTRYLAVRMGSMSIQAGLPVGPDARSEGDIERIELPGGRCAVTLHTGPYDILSETHAVLEAWLREQGHALGPTCREVYLTDPATQPDPAKWQTQIVMPLPHPA